MPHFIRKHEQTKCDCEINQIKVQEIKAAAEKRTNSPRGPWGEATDHEGVH